MKKLGQVDQAAFAGGTLGASVCWALGRGEEVRRLGGVAEPALLQTVSHTQLLHRNDCNAPAPSIQQLLHMYCRLLGRKQIHFNCVTETICGVGYI